jgi:hypothetical protein
MSEVKHVVIVQENFDGVMEVVSCSLFELLKILLNYNTFDHFGSLQDKTDNSSRGLTYDILFVFVVYFMTFLQ